MSTIRNQRDIVEPIDIARQLEQLDKIVGVKDPDMEKLSASLRDPIPGELRNPDAPKVLGALAGVGVVGVASSKFFMEAFRNKQRDRLAGLTRQINQELRAGDMAPIDPSELGGLAFFDLSERDRTERVLRATGNLFSRSDARAMGVSDPVQASLDSLRFGIGMDLGQEHSFSKEVVGPAVAATVGVPGALLSGNTLFNAFRTATTVEKAVGTAQKNLFQKTTPQPVQSINQRFAGVNVGPLSVAEAQSTLRNQARELQFDEENKLKFENRLITGLEPRIPLGTLEGNTIRQQNKLAQIGATVPVRKRRRRRNRNN